MLLNIIQTFTFISGYDYLAHGKTVRYSSSVSVCLSVCQLTYLKKHVQNFRNLGIFLCVLSMAVA